ncbi:MAG: response regulator [Myxococcota bacterium]
MFDDSVVDDDQTVAAMIRDMPTELGHEITVVTTADQALEHLNNQPDRSLDNRSRPPDMSGWQLARNARRIDPEITVGMVTGWSLAAHRDELRGRGIDFVLNKPFSLDALQDQIAHFAVAASTNEGTDDV